MTIEILSTRTIEEFREVEIAITDNGNSYFWRVGGLPLEGDLQAILDAKEPQILISALAAEVVPNTPDIEEHRDFYSLIPVINDELTWIDGAIVDVDNGLAAVGAFTNATQRAIITGLLNNQRRILLEQKRELKAWKHVIRWLD